MHNSHLALLTAATLLGAAGEGVAQEGTLIPLGEAEAIRIVDRYIDAANRGSLENMQALMAKDVRGFDYVTQSNTFAVQDWLSSPFEYPLLQLNLGFPPSLAASDELSVLVVDRMAAGSMVIQTEHWEARRSGTTNSIKLHVMYKVRGGQILRIWYLPTQERGIPVGFRPRHAPGTGPLVAFDVGHGNPATPDVLYSKMAELLRRDGYVVEVVDQEFSVDSLEPFDVLVVANALPSSHLDARSTPDEEVPSAFAETEIRAVVRWVDQGGSLLLIADHDPMPAASANLAWEFGASFMNGAVRDVSRPGGGGDVFSRADGTLLPHPITDGMSAGDRVESVRSFLGQAMDIADPLQALLLLHADMRLVRPGDGQDPDEWHPVGGLTQAAAGPFGQGRVALFGEAWMFRFFSSDEIDGNSQLILNLFRWLSEQAGTE